MSEKYDKKATIAAVVALSPSLAISWWSLFTMMKDAGCPVWLAAVTSGGIDGVCVVAGFTAHEAAAQGHSSRFVRTVLYALTFLSTVVNWDHGTAAGWTTGVHLLVAAMPGVAALAFEIIMQRTHRVEREKYQPRIRTRKAAKIDLDILLRQPTAVWQRRQKEALSRLDEVMPSDLRKRVSTREAVEAQGSTIRAHSGTLTALVAQIAPKIEELTGATPSNSTIEREIRRFKNSEVN